MIDLVIAPPSPVPSGVYGWSFPLHCHKISVYHSSGWAFTCFSPIILFPTQTFHSEESDTSGIKALSQNITRTESEPLGSPRLCLPGWLGK